MPKYTENYNLILPDQSENYDVDVANTNNKTIDTQLANKVDKIVGKGLSTNDFTNEYKKKIDSLQTLYRFKGNVENLEELNSKTNNNVGDVWKCEEDGNSYCWNKEAWINIGTDMDLSEYALKSELELKADKKQTDDKFVEIENTINQTSKNMQQHRYYLTLQKDLPANSELELPANYKVRYRQLKSIF